MNAIRQVLQREIARAGVIPFERFMELALYCPDIGYYARPETVIGRKGDFYTSVSVGSAFGELLAFQFAQWLEHDGAPDLVEAGAHDGTLAGDILGWLRQHRPSIYEALQYSIVEPLPAACERQKCRLAEFAGHVRWYETISELPARGVRGVFFCNELLDAFPVRRFGWDAHRQNWFEWGVGVDQDNFVWRRTLAPDAEDLLATAGMIVGRVPSRDEVELSPEMRSLLPDEFTVEVNPRAADWWRQAAQTLRQGKLLTIDYGFTADEFLARSPSGTLRAYYRHRLVPDILANPSEQDITAHVNFSHLQRVGETAGLTTDGLWTQEQFLNGIAQAPFSESSPFPQWNSGWTRQFQTLTHPEHLGRRFRVLVQSRQPQT